MVATSDKVLNVGGMPFHGVGECPKQLGGLGVSPHLGIE